MDNSQSQSPLVSVIIPAYNAEVFIERTLQSVVDQTYRHLEVLVVDDGSTDKTTEIVERFAASDSRIQLLRQPNAGVAAARNLGIASAQGELIAPIDSDDVWYPENLEKQVQCLMAADESVGLVYSWSADMDEWDRPTGELHASTTAGEVYATLICHNFIGNASATMIRKSCLDQVGGYNCELRKMQAQGCEDWDLYLRIAEQYQFAVVPEFLVGYRKISSSMSRNYEAMARSHARVLQFAHDRHPETPEALFHISKSSFYLYLARQSRQHQCYRGTLFWLVRALQVDLITPMFRAGLYALLIESYVRLSIKQVAAVIGPDNRYWMQLKQWLKLLLSVISPSKTTHRSLSLKFKILVGNLLHHSIPVMFGQSKV